MKELAKQIQIKFLSYLNKFRILATEKQSNGNI